VTRALLVPWTAEETMSESDGQRPDGAPESSDDRRGEPRHFACFPAHIQRPGGTTRMALIHDLSVTGALLLTRSRLAVGDEITLSLYLHEDATEVLPARARVLRVEPLAADRAEVWHFRAAVHFIDPLLGSEAEIEAIAARQAALGVRPD
jgi:PilZ domain